MREDIEITTRYRVKRISEDGLLKNVEGLRVLGYESEDAAHKAILEGEFWDGDLIIVRNPQINYK